MTVSRISAWNRRVGAGGRGVEEWVGFVVARVWALARLALHPHQVTSCVHYDNEFLGWRAEVECRDIFCLLIWSSVADSALEFHSSTQAASDTRLFA
jgi:hypothetical protein